MIKPFANSARASASGPLTWRTWAGLVVLPILVMSLFIWAFWSPEKNHGAAKAAVVNNDQPVTVNGKILPLGRELAGDLTHTEAAYSWVLTDADDARDGLARGDYGAVVTIPENFSAKATSSAGDDPMEAGQAELRVQTSNATGVADPLISTQIAKVVLRTLNQQIVQTYLENVYLSFSTIHDQLDKATDGAEQLATGADELKTGAGQLSSGSGQLASGIGNAQSKASGVTAPLRQLPAPPPGPLSAAASQIEQLASVHGAEPGSHRDLQTTRPVRIHRGARAGIGHQLDVHDSGRTAHNRRLPAHSCGHPRPTRGHHRLRHRRDRRRTTGCLARRWHLGDGPRHRAATRAQQQATAAHVLSPAT